MPSRRLRKNLGFILFPLSLLYGLGVGIRNALFNLGLLKSKEFDVPIVSVGNITVGGTGKTPHIEYLVKLLSKDLTTAVLSRGYKRKTKGYVLGNKKSTPTTLGDEPYQLFKKFPHASVAVCEKRVEGVENLLCDINGLNVILLDDAYQHRYIKPGVSIVLIDYNRPVFKDCLLPFGDLRERVHELRRAQIVIVTKVPKDIKPIEKRIWIQELGLYPYQFLYFTNYEYGNIKPVLNSKKKPQSMSDLRENNMEILVLTGIANPKPIFEYLEANNLRYVSLTYPDHYHFQASDIEKILKKYEDLTAEKKIILTTEKDAVRLQQIKDMPKTIRDNLYYLPIQVRFLDEKEEEFNCNILNYVRQNKKINRLHK